MNAAASLLIVAAALSAPKTPEAAGAQVVFSCDFNERWDRNYDQWPDGWTRLRDAKHPIYVPCRIEPEAPGDDRELRIDLDGAGAAILSPQIPASSAFTYLLRAQIRTQGLEHSRAFVSLAPYQAAAKGRESQVLKVIESEAQRHSEWTECLLGPVTLPEQAAGLVIGLHLEPVGNAELVGSAAFRNIRLERLPRIDLETGSAHHVFTDAAKVELRCRVSGLSPGRHRVSFKVLDALDVVVAQAEAPLEPDVVRQQFAPGAEGRSEPVFAGACTWRPPLPGHGFYHIRAAVVGYDEPAYRRNTTLVVVESRAAPESGEFGWALPYLGDPVPADALPSLLRHAGINWLKVPVWQAAGDPAQLDALATLAGRLGRERIEVVAVLDAPPNEIREHLVDAQHPLAADVFSADPTLWYPSLEAALVRLALKVRWWQLGADNDHSFVGLADLNPTLMRVRDELGRFSRVLHLGIGWTVTTPVAAAPDSPLAFVTLAADPPLTADELNAYLPDATGGIPAWVSITPLEKDVYDLQTRVADLVGRMTAARREGAAGIMAAAPFDSARGLMRPDGNPSELFLPWRTTALLLAGTQYIGRLELPGGSRNEVFGTGEQAVMVAWNHRPVSETAFLGNEVQQQDVWGRTSALTLAAGGRGQQFDCGPWPIFLTGLNQRVVRWQLGATLETTQIPCLLRRPHSVVLRLDNPFVQSASGHIEVRAPEGWEVRPASFDFHTEAGETTEKQLAITLPPDVVLGEHPLVFEVELLAGERHVFEMHRKVEVGLGEVLFEVQTRVNKRGELEVEQRIVHFNDEPISLECLLYAPDRKRERMFVRGLRNGEDVRTFRLNNAAELRGKVLWLRAIELDGSRVFNYRFVAP